MCWCSARVFRIEEGLRAFEKEKREFMNQFGLTPIPKNQVISSDDLLAWLPRDLFLVCVSFYHTYVPLKIHLFEPVLSMLRRRLHIYPGGHCHCNRYQLWTSGTGPCDSRGVHYLALEKLVTQDLRRAKRQQRRYGRCRRRKRSIHQSFHSHQSGGGGDNDDARADDSANQDHRNKAKGKNKAVETTTTAATQQGMGQKPIKRRRVDSHFDQSNGEAAD